MGLTYLFLGTWCLLDPHGTSRAVGFTLNGASGLSEYLAVYGGLELGMGLWFALGAVNATLTKTVLLSLGCLHAPILIVRQMSLLLVDGVGTTTVVLAIAEIIIVLLTVAAWWSLRAQATEAPPPATAR